MRDHTCVRVLFDWNEYLDSLVIKRETREASLEAFRFIQWCRDKQFESLSLACQIYQASTGIKLKPQDFIPF